MFTDRRASSRTTRRTPQVWGKERPFKILSLDGGGIKGVYTAELLRRCEETFCASNPLRSHFDMIAGTSTGGIIALALSVDMATAEICRFYAEDGRKIFPPLPVKTFDIIDRALRSLFRPKLDHEALEAALQRRFQGTRLGAARTRLAIPAFMTPKTEIAVFKTDHHSDFRNDHATPMWKIARATSAAPTYLQGLEHTESGRVFLDGGVWANNPAMVALTDALSAYDVTREQIRILSIGTGNPPFTLPTRSARGGIIAWREAIKAAMFLTTDNALAQAMLLIGPERCVRLEPKGAAAEIEMDDYDRAHGVLPELAHADFENARDDLAAFFAETVQPRERHYSADGAKS